MLEGSLEDRNKAQERLSPMVSPGDEALGSVSFTEASLGQLLSESSGNIATILKTSPTFVLTLLERGDWAGVAKTASANLQCKLSSEERLVWRTVQHFSNVCCNEKLTTISLTPHSISLNEEKDVDYLLSSCDGEQRLRSVLLMQGFFELSRGMSAKALVTFDKILKLDSSYSLAEYFSGVALLEQERYREAAKSFIRTEQLNGSASCLAALKLCDALAHIPRGMLSDTERATAVEMLVNSSVLYAKVECLSSLRIADRLMSSALELSPESALSHLSSGTKDHSVALYYRSLNLLRQEQYSEAARSWLGPERLTYSQLNRICAVLDELPSTIPLQADRRVAVRLLIDSATDFKLLSTSGASRKADELFQLAARLASGREIADKIALDIYSSAAERSLSSRQFALTVEFLEIVQKHKRINPSFEVGVEILRAKHYSQDDHIKAALCFEAALKNPGPLANSPERLIREARRQLIGWWPWNRELKNRLADAFVEVGRHLGGNIPDSENLFYKEASRLSRNRFPERQATPTCDRALRQAISSNDRTTQFVTDSVGRSGNFYEPSYEELPVAPSPVNIESQDPLLNRTWEVPFQGEASRPYQSPVPGANGVGAAAEGSGRVGSGCVGSGIPYN